MFTTLSGKLGADCRKPMCLSFRLPVGHDDIYVRGARSLCSAVLPSWTDTTARHAAVVLPGTSARRPEPRRTGDRRQWRVFRPARHSAAVERPGPPGRQTDHPD